MKQSVKYSQFKIIYRTFFGIQNLSRFFVIHAFIPFKRINDQFQRDNKSNGGKSAQLRNLKLILYGTKNMPAIMKEKKLRSSEVCIFYAIL